MLTPPLEIILIIINGFALVLSISILILTIWQNPGTGVGGALTRFILSLILLNASVLLTFGSLVMFGSGSGYGRLFDLLSLAAFSLNSLMAFGLIIHAADQMREIWVVLSRAGVVGLLLLQWPLWTGQLFTSNDTVMLTLERYTPTGLVVVTMNLAYIVLGISAGIAWRNRIRPRILLIGLIVLLVGQGLTLVFALLRQIAFPSLLSSVVGTVIGVALVRMQFFNPLNMRTAQLDAITELARIMSGRGRLPEVLNVVAEQARAALNTDVALVFLVDRESKLVIAAQQGGAVPLLGRILYAGEGLAGRVYQLQETLTNPNYHAWDGRSEVFNDIRFYGSLSVPILDGDDCVGVLNLHEIKPGRSFTERDQRTIQMIAALAALSISHKKQRAELDHLRAHLPAFDKRSTGSLHFDENGTLMLGESP